MADPNTFPSPTVETVIPSGPQLVALANTAITDSFRKSNSTQFALPSLWRLAHNVIYEDSPISIYSYEQVGQ